ncbi:MAG: hypothetical protein GY810_28810 [Aureispira sp.]|nr:hypothetical protein [Aureispira sp.]
MKSLNHQWLLAIMVAVFGYACNSATVETSNKVTITPPLPGLETSYTVFEIDPTEDQILEMPSGTNITIRANSLVNAEGKLVKDKVSLKYREYHDAVDILLSGIPMDYTVQGQKRTMQTAGMFDVKAEQNGKELALADGATMRVDLASYEEGNDYSFFWLDQDNEGWEFVDHVEPIGNGKREAIQKEIKTLEKKLRKSKRQKEKYFVFDFNTMLDVMYADDFKGMQNAKHSTVAAKAKKYDLTWLKNAPYAFVEYKGNNYTASMMVWENISGKHFPKWIYNKDTKLKLTKLNGDVYELFATATGGAKTAKLKVKVVMPLKYVFEYSPKKWKKNFNSILKEVSKEEAKIRKQMEELQEKEGLQAATIRSFELVGFGIYNYDKLMKEEDRIEVLADFEVKTNTNPLDLVFCLPEDNKTVIKYPTKDWNKVNLLPNNAARFITFLPNNTIGLYAAEEYKSIDFDAVRNQSEPKYNFTLVKVLEGANSQEAIRELLNM